MAIDFIGVNSGGESSLGPQAPMNCGCYHVSSGFTDCTASPTNLTINGGDFCLFMYTVSSIKFDGNWGVCGGVVQVQDVNAAAPGSVIASGSINVTQEAMVLGGVLSGAYYASGIHLSSTTGLNTDTSNGVPSPPVGLSHNMNYFCASACAIGTSNGSSSNPGEFCIENCGHYQEHTDPISGGYTSQADPGNASIIPSHMVNSYISTFPYNSGGIYSWASGVVNAGSATTQWPSVWGPACSGGANFPVAPTVYTTPQATGELRTANDHYAGGMVYEIEMGPLMSICSGNYTYYQNGGQDFTHAGGVDGHAFILGSATCPGCPPERLICNHRHAQPDLYLGVGSSMPFPINGGAPF